MFECLQEVDDEIFLLFLLLSRVLQEGLDDSGCNIVPTQDLSARPAQYYPA